MPRPGSDGVTFAAVFSGQSPDAAALATGATIAARMRITNASTAPWLFAPRGSVRPELHDATGAVVPFSGGTNLAAAPKASDSVKAAPGESIELPVDAVLRLRDGQLIWRGGDGLMGFWRVSRADAPLPAGAHLSNTARLPGLWPGVGRTQALPLP